MANDRLYLMCNECGDKLFIAKTWGDRVDVHRSAKVIESWLSDHVVEMNPYETNFSLLNEVELVKENK